MLMVEMPPNFQATTIHMACMDSFGRSAGRYGEATIEAGSVRGSGTSANSLIRLAAE
jgi:hypothetical protein